MYGKRKSSYQLTGPHKIRRNGTSSIRFNPVPSYNFYKPVIDGSKIVKRIRQRVKEASSYTRTMTKKKPKREEKVTETGISINKLPAVKMYRKRAKHGKLLGTYKYNNINSWITTGLQGHQVSDYGEILFGRDQLLGETISSDRKDRGRYADDLFKLNPFNAVPTSALYSAVTPAATDMLYIKNVNLKLDMLSMIKVPMEVIVYFMSPKFDTDSTPLAAWEQILVSKRLGQATPVGATTLAGTPTAVAGYAQTIDYGENPFVHSEFRKMWTAVSTKKLVIQAGEQRNLEVNIDYEKIISRQTIKDERKMYYLKGLTIVPFIIVRAALEGVASDGSSAATEVSYSQPKIGFVVNQRMIFGALPQSRISTARTFTGQLVNDTTDVAKIIDDNDQIINVLPNL